YKPFKNAVLDWLISRSRLRDVAFVVAREAGMMKLVRSMQPGQLLFFLPDQDHGVQHSVFAPFFAASKATLNTPARMAKLGQATALPVMAFWDGARYRVVIGPALAAFGQQGAEVDARTMNAGFEALIRRQPQQYMWTLKLFRTRPVGQKRVY
ncbi:MAG: lipid A biosynthesis acyltransferase, partial [Thiothrix sp.]|nr:lipid A biosynthesis acyltransferase [Thiothrix sp.]